MALLPDAGMFNSRAAAQALTRVPRGPPPPPVPEDLESWGGNGLPCASPLEPTGQPSAIGEDTGSSDSLASLLRAVLEEHTRVVKDLYAENRRLVQECGGSGSGKAPSECVGYCDDYPDRLTFDSRMPSSSPCAPAGTPPGGSDSTRSATIAGDDDGSSERLSLADRHVAAQTGGIIRKGVPLVVAEITDSLEASTDDAEEERPSFVVSIGSRLSWGSQQSNSCNSAASNPRNFNKSRSSVTALLKQKSENEEPSVGPLERFMHGPFEKVSSLIILLNVVFVFLQLQYQGYLHGVGIGVRTNDVPDLTGAITLIDIVFNIFFAVELATRLSVLRCHFFFFNGKVEVLHFLDAFLVCASCADLYLFSQGQSSRGLNLNVLRPFRFLRFVRTLRVLQSVKVFSKLRMLVNTVGASFLALFWSIVLLGLVMLLAALFLCQSVSSAVEDEAIPLETRVWIYKMYGTSARSFWTVFELTFSGGWPNFARPLVEEISSAFAVFFFVYIIVVVFAMFRIITALFLRDTLAFASRDAEAAVQERVKQKESYASKLLEFFHAADTSKDGFLTLAEFQAILEDDGVKTWMSLMEVDVHDAEHLFSILDGDDGLVSPDEFVQGILRLKGQARSQDVLRIMHCCDRLVQDMAKLQAWAVGLDGMSRSREPVSALGREPFGVTARRAGRAP